MAGKRVLSVGQCGADNWSISRSLRRHFGAEVIPVDSPCEAVERVIAEAFDLVLVNRVLDADGTSGVDLIRRLCLARGDGHPAIMLVSNYEDAQRQAAEAGAVPGFGKASLGQPHMLARLGKYLGETEPETSPRDEVTPH
jgi:CheY-like chemotaxis protein